jgi:hypothetical protein
MKSTRKLLAGIVTTGLALAAAQALADRDRDKEFRARLKGLEEVPSVSTRASGRFELEIDDNRGRWRLRYEGLEGDVQQAHIHFGQISVNGGISVFLCSNLGNGPAGTQGCPPSPATVTGDFDANDVIGPPGQGITSGQLDELVRAIKQGAAYANVHSTSFPGVEIRGQIRDD